VEWEAKGTNSAQDQLLATLAGPPTRFHRLLNPLLASGAPLPRPARIWEQIDFNANVLYQQLAENLGTLATSLPRLRRGLLRKLYQCEVAMVSDHFTVLMPLYEVLIHGATVSSLKAFLDAAARHNNGQLIDWLVERIRQVSAHSLPALAFRLMS
jgi:hypothetical protein